jgi:glycosyltransferase involved in cell wall biosynthesis
LTLAGTPAGSRSEVAAAPATASPATLPLVVFVHGSAEMYGSDKVLLNLVSALASDTALKPVVVLHETGPLVAALQAAGLEVHVACVVKINRAMFGPAVALVLWRELRRACADLDRIVDGRPVGLVYSNTLAVLGGAFWAWRRKLHHLWHVHEIILKPALVRVGLPRLADWLSQQVITNSQQTQSWLLQQAPGLATRSVVVFNGLPHVPASAPGAVRAFRQRMGVAPDDLLVTVAGRLNHWKGQELLIDAAASLLRAGRLGGLHFAVVGDVFAGQEHILRSLVQRVSDAGLQARVHFVPFVADIYVVWRASDIAVVPSLEPEPFGMVAIEAMACGLPVIAAAHGGLLDIVEDRQTGLLFKPRDALALAEAIAQLAADPALRQRLGQAGAARQAALFSLSAQVAQTRALCMSLMPARPSLT